MSRFFVKNLLGKKAANYKSPDVTEKEINVKLSLTWKQQVQAACINLDEGALVTLIERHIVLPSQKNLTQDDKTKAVTNFFLDLK